MTVLAMAGLSPLYDACRSGQAQYAEAAGMVGDPGLKLQFNHIAAAREALLDDIAAVLGLEATPAAIQEEAGTVARDGRRPLGGEVRRRTMKGDELCTLVRGLREQDEHLLFQMRQHAGATPCIATTEVLERAIVLLSGDLEKIRILETLAAGQVDPSVP